MLGSIYIICGSLIIILLCYATIMLCITLWQTKNFKKILFFAGFAFAFACCIAGSFLFAIFLLDGTFADSQHVTSSDGFLWIGTGVACFLIAMCFRISLQKEIELSKSATSSTSSMSSKGSSSSGTTSSRSDPVIEL